MSLVKPGSPTLILGPALLAAGLFFGVSLGAAEEMPTRRVAPTSEPSPTATPEVRAEDLRLVKQDVERLRSDLSATAKMQEAASRVALKAEDEAWRKALDAQGDALRRAAEAEAVASKAALQGLSDTARSLERSLLRLGQSLDALNTHVDTLDLGQSQQATGLGSLRKDLELSEATTAKAREEMGSLKKELDARTRMLESLTDLLSVMRKDLETQGEEVVETKQELKKLQKGPEALSGEWWEQVSAWRYWPAVAVVASGVAVGVAFSR